jgi:hypothetical protein
MSDIILTIPDWKHKKLLQRLETLKQAMRLFKINDAFKKAYLDDIYGIEGILKQSNNHGGNGHERK